MKVFPDSVFFAASALAECILNLPPELALHLASPFPPAPVLLLVVGRLQDFKLLTACSGLITVWK